MKKETILERITELAELARNNGRAMLGSALEDLYSRVDSDLVDLEDAA